MGGKRERMWKIGALELTSRQHRDMLRWKEMYKYVAEHYTEEDRSFW